MAQVIIMRGLPGSGKSTYISQYKEDNPRLKCVVCSNDDYRMVNGVYTFDATKNGEVAKECYLEFIRLLEYPLAKYEDYVVFVDNTNIRAWELAPYVMYATAMGHKVKIVSLYCPPLTAHIRNVHEVSLSTIINMYNGLTTEVLPSFWHIEHTYKLRMV